MRLVQAVLICLFPTFASAATEIRSGEHADFSRLVFQFSTSPEWEFGRVAGGYELQFTPAADQFAANSVFDFIPRTRILSVTTRAPGRVFIGTECDCHGDAFEIRQGRLVLDIKDGSANRNAQFETPPKLQQADRVTEAIQDELPDLPNAMASTPQRSFQETRNSVVELGFAISGTEPQASNTGSFAEIAGDSSPDTAKDSGMASPANKAVDESGKPNSWPKKVKRNSSDGRWIPASKPKTSTQQDTAENRPASKAQSAANIQLQDSEIQVLENVFQRWKNPEVSRTKSTLLMQLSRASAQGLINANTTNEIKPSGLSDKFVEEKTMKSVKNARIEGGFAQHIRIETAVDRDRHATQKGVHLPQPGIGSEGQICLSDSVIGVGNWGGFSSRDLNGFRANLLLEFDIPDPDAIQKLARQYVFLGFGAETIALLNDFDEPFEGRDTLILLAEIMDHGFAKSAALFAGQSGCVTSAALWAVMSDSKIDNIDNVDTGSVVRTFAGLPLHLRHHIGPGLSLRFLSAGDAETATTIRNIILRSAGKPKADFNLLEARLKVDRGHIEEATSQLKDGINDNGTELASTIIELIGITLESGGNINKKTADLAEALAYENRGTLIGRELTEIAIRGLIASGEISRGFEFIRKSTESGDISDIVATTLRAAAHQKNADIADDILFLQATMANPVPLSDDGRDTQLAKRKSAQRLIGLGFYAEAKSFLVSPHQRLDPEDKLILARIAIDENDPNKVFSLLAGDTNDTAVLLKAEAHELLREFEMASSLYRSIGETEDQQSAAWRSGDWNRIANAFGTEDDTIFGIAAAHVMESENNSPAQRAGPEDATGSDTEKPDINAFTDQRLAEGLSRLARSRIAREIVEKLLN